MPQPQWITPAGSLGTIAEGIFYRLSVRAEAQGDPVFFRLIAGQLPEGVQVTESGTIEGTPETIERVQGVPLEVSRDVTSRFAIRAYTRRLVNGQYIVDRLADRTFTLTITGQDLPEFLTPAGNIGTYYDGSEVDIQLAFTDNDPDDEVTVRLAGGELPPGLVLDSQGRISGAIVPLIGPPNTARPGEDASPWDFYPWDFRTRAESKNFQFTVEITDGKQSNVRSFEIYVYAKDDMTADTVNFTADNTFVTADVTPLRTPVILNPQGSIGTSRYDNFFAYRFNALDFDGDDYVFLLSAGPGVGFDNSLFDQGGTIFDQGAFTQPSALNLNFDLDTGWLTGYIPELGAVEQTYVFALRVQKRDLPQYVSGYYFYSLNIISDVDTEVTWLTDSYLGSIDNGAVSMFFVRAVSPENYTLQYRLASGSNSRLPQGLTLLPSGNIVGRASFNTFALDGGTTTFDINLNRRLGIDETTFDLTFDFRVNAFAPSSQQIYSRVGSITVTNGGSNYNNTQVSVIRIIDGGDLYDPLDPPTVTIEPPPVLPGNVPAVAGAITIEDGKITAIAIANPGQGYVTAPAITISGGAGIGAQASTTIGVVVNIAAPPPIVGADQATARAVISDGVVVSIPIISGGANYIGQPTVTIFGAATTPAQVRDVTIVGGSITAINLASGGSGYLVPPNVSIFGGGDISTLVPAEIGTAVLADGVITAINVGNPGAGYIETPAVSFVSASGSGAAAVSNLVEYDRQYTVSVFRDFQIRLIRRFNEPYETLYIRAMPGLQDRALINDLINNTTVIPESVIYRNDDPNFGRATDVTYDHAYGLAAASLDTYVQSLDLNHYWRDLVLGSVTSAVARDSSGNVVYEVVYSQIRDDLINNDGVSVGKSVTLPYAVDVMGQEINTVYPNSLPNMRDQVIDVVGQVSPALPLWMLSKQENEQVLGFRPAWIIAYVQPGQGKKVAYNVNQYLANQPLTQRINAVDFEIDRYELDRSQTRNWDPAIDLWVPQPPAMTTFDLYSTPPNLYYLGYVDYATTEAYSDINERTLTYIAQRGGIEGDFGRQINGRTIIFQRQEGFVGLTPDQAFTDYVFPYDNQPYDESGTDYDESVVLTQNQRLWVYRIRVSVNDIVTLEPVEHVRPNGTVSPVTQTNDYVQILRGTFIGQRLYIPSVPDPGQTVRTWSNIPETVTTQTVFDHDSTRFITPTDRWTASNEFDKYLVFPKRTILG